MPLRYQKYITRQDLIENRNQFYVFGDNIRRTGLKGQAAEMRGEPNAIGIPTKWKPSMSPEAFFRDRDASFIYPLIKPDLLKVYAHLKQGKVVIWPSDGIGTGLSKLPKTAPMIWESLEEARRHFEFM